MTEPYVDLKEKWEQKERLDGHVNGFGDEYYISIGPNPLPFYAFIPIEY